MKHSSSTCVILPLPEPAAAMHGSWQAAAPARLRLVPGTQQQVALLELSLPKRVLLREDLTSDLSGVRVLQDQGVLIIPKVCWQRRCNRQGTSPPSQRLQSIKSDPCTTDGPEICS